MEPSLFIEFISGFREGDRVLEVGCGTGSLTAEARGFMKSKVKYTDEPMGKLRIVDDFLPKPEDLVFKEDNVKITMALSKSSVDFFKAEARKHHTSYQAMIRRLLDLYASRHTTSASVPSGTRAKRRRAA